MKTRALFLALCAAALTAPVSVSGQVEPVFDTTAQEDLLFPVRVDGEWGVVDASGTFVVPAEYQSVWIRSDGSIQLSKDGKAGVANGNGTVTIPFEFRYVSPFNGRDYTLASTGGDDVVIDLESKVVLGPGFAGIRFFDQDRSFVVTDGRIEGVVTLDCEWVIKPGYKRIGLVQDNGLSRAEPKSNSVGYIDKAGKWVIRPNAKKFDRAYHFSDVGLAAARSEGKWGFIASSGEWMIDPFADGPIWGPRFNGEPARAVVEIGGKKGMIAPDSTFVIPAEYDRLSGMYNGAVVGSRDGKFGAFDANGNVIVPFEFKALGWFNTDGMASGTKDGRRISVDLAGKEYPLPKFEQVGTFGQRTWAPAKRDGKWGAINNKGEWLLQPQFDCVQQCYDDRISPPPPPSSIRASSGPSLKRLAKNSRQQEWCRIDD
ncbi:MAG: WG repeat-containing protein [Pseudomonadota bacterium]